MELSTAQSLKCKLIFYVIFQYIFYSLNLFENFCCLFYQKKKEMHLFSDLCLRLGALWELNEQHRFQGLGEQYKYLIL